MLLRVVRRCALVDRLFMLESGFSFCAVAQKQVSKAGVLPYLDYGTLSVSSSRLVVGSELHVVASHAASTHHQVFIS